MQSPDAEAQILQNAAFHAAISAGSQSLQSPSFNADSLLLSHWYQMQMQRLATEQYSLGIPHYLAHGKLNSRFFFKKTCIS